jgi:hypothetical protein
MMPSNHLMLLAMLALGYLGLLSTHVRVRDFVRFAHRVVHCSWDLYFLRSVEYPER